MSEGYPLYDEIARKYYRLENDGKLKVYEPTVTLSGGLEIPESRLEEHNKRQREADQKRFKEEKKRKTEGHCPFKVNTFSIWCDIACAWWSESGCLLLSDKRERIEGKCPISNRKCDDKCVMRKNEECLLLERRKKND